MRLLCAAHNLNGTELARKIHFSKQYLSAVISGQRPPSRKLLEHIARELKVPLSLITMLAADPEEYDLEERGKALTRLLGA